MKNQTTFLNAFIRSIAMVATVSLLLMGLPAKAQTGLISAEFISTVPSGNIPGDWPGIPRNYDTDNYKLVYYTTGVDGTPDVASGLISIPNNTGCDALPMLVYCHEEASLRQDVPSNIADIIPLKLASSGFITVSPDYLGYGGNTGPHLFIHQESLATTTIDLVYAAREFLSSGQVSVLDNGQLFVTGYSEGGYAAMATLKYAEDHGLNEDLGIVAGTPSSGPYNMSGVMGPAVIYEQIQYVYMGSVAFATETYQNAYGNLYNSADEFYKSPYDQLIPSWTNESYAFDFGQANSYLSGFLSNWVQDSVVTNMQNNPNHPIWQDLRANDTFDWTPHVPLRMLYCSGDNQIPYQNSTTAETAMLANGAEDVQAVNVLPGADHDSCQAPAFTATYDFFTSLATMCTLGVDENNVADFAVYPNPVKSNVTIAGLSGTETITLYDMSGKQLQSTKATGDKVSLNLNGLTSGVYLVEITSDNGNKITKKVLKK